MNLYYKEQITMERKPIFTGAASALITPMNSNGVDYENFEKLINSKLENFSVLFVCES